MVDRARDRVTAVVRRVRAIPSGHGHRHRLVFYQYPMVCHHELHGRSTTHNAGLGSDQLDLDLGTHQLCVLYFRLNVARVY